MKFFLTPMTSHSRSLRNHERRDGSGYPDGKKGTEIPLEARIMAIAEMGKQFDPGLKSAYQKASPRPEEYYGTNSFG